ncbi:hypothetical protein C8J57DRAFT_1224220 [Mycena rebaudengoi]|nr:hypothetical protein C8J57DRAFT_1224220 [Mycena rebaudengoi]
MVLVMENGPRNIDEVQNTTCRRSVVFGVPLPQGEAQKMYAIGAPCGCESTLGPCLQPAKRARKIEEGRKVPEFPANSAGAVAASQRLNFDFLAFTSRGFEAVGRKDVDARAAEGEGLILNFGVEFEAARSREM